MLKMTYALLHNSRVCCRSASIFTQIKDMSTSTVLEANPQKANLNLDNEEIPLTPTNALPPFKASQYKNKIVAAAFASLSKDSNKMDAEISTPHTDKKISNATNVNELLSVSNGEGVSRRLALKIVSVLADWTSSKKIKLSDFENDYRFIKLCKVLTRNKPERYVASKSEDLSTVLSVTADEEAAKLIQTITLPQMVKVMKTLSNKKRRSTLLLRTLAYNISGNPDKLNLKYCSDLLFSMSSLNFVDENLLSKVALDICNDIETENEAMSSAVIGSILTSLGLLKYKNPLLLDVLCTWLIQNCDTCRSQDVFSLFFTLASLNYIPADLDKLLNVFAPYLTELEAGSPTVWLDHVWSKVVLNIATQEEISHVLSPPFLNSILETPKSKNLSTSLKILNINGAANCLVDNYKGNKLPTVSTFREVSLTRRKEKGEFCESIITSLKNLMNTEKYLKVNTDSGYGFSIDAECILDENFNPKELNTAEIEGTRIAIMPLDYHDMTRGRLEPVGINVFARRILKAQGFKVLNIPYNEYNPQAKLIVRVQYLEKSLKELVKRT